MTYPPLAATIATGLVVPAIGLQIARRTQVALRVLSPREHI